MAKGRKGELSRNRLLDVAERMFIERGHAAASMQDIARAAGTTIGGIYFHFRSRDELAVAVMERSMRAVWTRVAEAVAALPDDAGYRLRIRAAVEAHINAVIEHGDLTAYVGYIKATTPGGDWTSYDATRDGFRAFWRNLIIAAQKAGVMRADADPTLMVFFCFGALSWVREWYNPRRRSVRRIADDFTGYLLESVAAEDPAGGALAPALPLGLWAAPRASQVRAAPRTSQVRAAPRTSQVRTAPRTSKGRAAKPHGATPARRR